MSDPDARLVQRQAFAGMIWSKQFFYYDVPEWIKGDPAQPPPPAERKQGRNHEWLHLNNADIISMPDKWEYPWYAAWDLAFHCIPLALVDPEFAKSQLVLLTREWYMHPNGQLPAYEWAFGDVNPPVHAWATWRVFQMDRKQRREQDPNDPGDLAFLERVFHKLMLNFTWWVNRKDAQGRNIFQGGFLGLDNIGVFDRSAPLPTGGFINQADGTSWMAMYSLNLMRIALELARHNDVYQDIATKFFEHFLHIAEAMNNIGEEGIGLWDEQDEFYYDVLNLPDGRMAPLKVRSMVGLIPLFAVEVLEPGLLEELPEFTERLEWFLNYRPDLAKLVSRWNEPGMKQRHLLSLLRGHRMKCLLRRMLDETEFLSDYGVRALSRHHLEHPYRFPLNGHTLEVSYQSGRVQFRPVWRQFQLARAHLDAGQLSLDRVLAEIPPLLRRRLQDRMPGGLRPIHDHQRSGRRAIPAPDALVLEGPRWPAPGSEISSQAGDRSALSRLRSVPRVFRRRQWQRSGRVAPNRLDGTGRQTASAQENQGQARRSKDDKTGIEIAFSRDRAGGGLISIETNDSTSRQRAPLHPMTTEQNRIYLDQQFFASLMKADVTSLSQLLADDFTLVDVMTGSEVDKPAFLTVVGSGQLKFETH